MHSAPAGEIGLRDQRELDRREDGTAVDRRDHDVRGRALFGEHLLDARLRAAALGGNEDLEAVGLQRVDAAREPFTVSDNRVERTCREYGILYKHNTTFLSAVRSHYNWLREMGRAPILAARS